MSNTRLVSQQIGNVSMKIVRVAPPPEMPNAPSLNLEDKLNEIRNKTKTEVIKTNFNLSSSSNLDKTTVGNIFIDNLNDLSGIDNNKSINFTFDSVNGLISGQKLALVEA